MIRSLLWVTNTKKMKISINKKEYSLADIDPETPLLWVIRDEVGLKGTKFGCGLAQCGACTVHIDGEAVRSCSYPVQYAENKEITTIEGLSQNDQNLHPIQQAWIEHQVPQCGYCQPGFMMAAAELLAKNPAITETDIRENITNICRCGTQPRIISAILKAAEINKSNA